MTRAKRTRTCKQAGLAAPESSRRGTARTASRTELGSYEMPGRLPLAERSRMAMKVALLEGSLFDDEGHLRPGLGDEVASTRLGEINDLRRDLGWLSLDLHHDYVWPAEIAS